MLNNLGVILRFQGKLEEAETCYREALAQLDKNLEGNFINRGVILKNLASVLVAQGRDSCAERFARESIAIYASVLTEDHACRLDADAVLASSWAGRGRFEEAEALVLSAYSRVALAPAAESQVAQILNRVIDLYELWDKPEEAAKYRALRLGKSHQLPDDFVRGRP